MKRNTLLAFAILLVCTSFGQTNLGLKASLNISNQKLSASGDGMSAGRSGTSIVGFQIGGFADIPLSQNFSFNPELLLSAEGANFSDDATGEPIQPRLYYLRMPYNFLYETPIPGDAKFFFGAGPEIGIGLFGKANAGNASTKAFQDSLFGRFDMGLNFVGGVQLKYGYRISVNYYLGMTSITTSTFNSLVLASAQGISSFRWRNNTFSISVGYVINTSRPK
jgi:hypothetical protein